MKTAPIPKPASISYKHWYLESNRNLDYSWSCDQMKVANLHIHGVLILDVDIFCFSCFEQNEFKIKHNMTSVNNYTSSDLYACTSLIYERMYIFLT